MLGDLTARDPLERALRQPGRRCCILAPVNGRTSRPVFKHRFYPILGIVAVYSLCGNLDFEWLWCFHPIYTLEWTRLSVMLKACRQILTIALLPDSAHEGLTPILEFVRKPPEVWLLLESFLAEKSERCRATRLTHLESCARNSTLLQHGSARAYSEKHRELCNLH